MAKTRIGSNAVFTPSTGLSILGNHCYAVSGAIGITQSETTILEFYTSAKNYITGQIQINYAVDQTENALYKIYFNGNIISSWVVPGGSQSPAPEQPLVLVIPPGTLVKVTAIMLSGASPRTHYATLTGKVHA